MKKIILYLFLILALTSCNKKVENVEDTQKTIDIKAERIKSVCELATLECYYHNVAKYEKTSGGFGQKDRRFWLEYNGKAKFGIADLNRVVIVTEGNNINIDIPKPILISTTPDKNIDRDSFVEDENKYGLNLGVKLFENKITAKDQTEAIDQAENQIREKFASDNYYINKARENAKELIKSYVDSVSSLANKEYVVTFNDLDE